MAANEHRIASDGREPQAALAPTGLDFSAVVPTDGYRWWYLDAFSDDGRAGMTIILFVGSVFSPYYFSARQRGLGNPENFCSANVIFYGPDRKRWAMTERGTSELQRTATQFVVGPTRVAYRPGLLTLDIDERCVPLPTRLRGRVEVVLPTPNRHCFALDDAGCHRWWPIAPHARVSIDLSAAGLCWEGPGYLDCNAGTEPLERAFRTWQWQRSELVDGSGAIVYDAIRSDGSNHQLHLGFSGQGDVYPIPGVVPAQSLPTASVWRMPRTGFDTDARIRVEKTLEDTPFYARSLLQMTTAAGTVRAMHESLDLQRFTRPWVQRLLPFRMPRRAKR